MCALNSCYVICLSFITRPVKYKRNKFKKEVFGFHTCLSFKNPCNLCCVLLLFCKFDPVFECTFLIKVNTSKPRNEVAGNLQMINITLLGYLSGFHKCVWECMGNACCFKRRGSSMRFHVCTIINIYILTSLHV